MTREQVKVDFNGLTHDHLMVNKRDTVNSGCRTNGTTMPTTTTTTTTINHFHANQTTDNNNRSSLENDRSNQENLNNSTDVDDPSTTLSTIAILRRLAMYDSLVLVKRYRACINGYTLEFPTSNLSNQPDDDNSNIETTQQKQQQHDKQHEQDCRKTKLVSMYLDGDDPIYLNQEKKNKDSCLCTPDQGEIVYVPMNGLMARLDNYDRHGVSIDSRVYAFAMGLKTAEIFLTTSSMKEIQETPQL